MNNNANEPINPIRGKMQGETDYKGLTKREYFAGLAMQGIMANRWSMELGNYSDEMLVKQSVGIADALISELAKQK